MENYDKLVSAVVLDEEKLSQFARAKNELAAMEERVEELNEIIEDNEELEEFVWRDSLGIHTAIHDLDGNHLKNIVRNLPRLNVSKKTKNALKAEFKKRFDGEALPAPRVELLEW